ncbi:hypothetical protein B0A49_12558 [Cryomyces minteri]|uniref:Uncharacterized protein n=1 Tax=Cryomyces minteri TaxID=331657 RepID=A0A4U0V7N9_9PEZI|nr:hypothetical protein B0A49_12558 [Cryomyces minteri]
MLRTFAEATSELHKLQFSKASALYFNDDDDASHRTIELSYRAREEDFGLMRVYVTFELQISSRHMESAAARTSSSTTSLVNDEANNTDILDWAGLETAPHFFAWSSFPLWLWQDWQVGYVWPDDDGLAKSIAPENYDLYRVIFARPMRNALGDESDANQSVSQCVLLLRV